jgi:maltooligosyltrehalose trehalohydrolase
VRFRVWAPERREVAVVFEGGGAHPLEKQADGTFAALVASARAGDRYRYRLDNDGAFPDPVSRFQPEGVHGPSEVIDPAAFAWTDGEWRGGTLDDLVLYELHVGTFTPDGTFAAAAERLPFLRDLGVTAVELLPVADFPGRRNWGYDGVSLFAPARCYGRPDDLRRFVDRAHALGLAVLQDVVYNHFGPDGAYQGTFSPHYFTDRHRTPWGQAINFDGPHAEMVREYFVENAAMWLAEYHMDGLRLDATHSINDESGRHFLAELTARARAAAPDRATLLIAEDHRNLARMIQPEDEAGYGLDAQWSDDFHHGLRRFMTGDRDGYFRDYSGRVQDLAVTIRDGWLFRGEYSDHFGEPRGTDPTGVALRQCVVFLQNHDQVGNRVLGQRLHHEIDPAAYRALVVLMLCAPETPLLWMGQEWAASTPFLYFTDHHDALGRAVREGRRREFKSFAAFADPAARERIPDPQADETFTRSRLDWSEVEREPHASVLRLHRAAIALRQGDPLLRASGREGFTARARGEDALVLSRRDEREGAIAVLVQLRRAGAVSLGEGDAGFGLEGWSVVLDTEEFATDPAPPAIDLVRPAVRFTRPGAVVLRAR